MTPAAKNKLNAAVETAQLLTPRINNALIRARHRAADDCQRIELLEEARRRTTDVLSAIQQAELAFKANRRGEV